MQEEWHAEPLVQRLQRTEKFAGQQLDFLRFRSLGRPTRRPLRN